MKRIIKNIKISIFTIMAVAASGCSDLMTTSSSTLVPEETATSSTSNLNYILTSAYRRLYFNMGGADRVYAGLTGLQMYVDLGGADIMSHTNMGGTQVTSYEYQKDKTMYTNDAANIWTCMYSIINQVNIVLDNIDTAAGDDADRRKIRGQALAIRGLCYFHLIQNYQQTYIIARDKPGVMLRTSAADPVNMPRNTTVTQCYDLIVSDLAAAKTDLQGFTRENKWTIDQSIVSGILARVYLVMNKWQLAFDEASLTYNQYSTLMTRDQYRSGFDDAITNNYAEVAWAVKFTDTDNLGGSTQFNFWYNQDASYGEGNMDGPIYSFLDFFADGEFEKLFEKTEDRYQFWKRTNNESTELNTKWVYDKYKHYGDKNGAVQGNTRPEVSLMRGSEMLLIMAETAAQLGNGTDALTYLTRLQQARGVTNLTTATGQELLEAIYRERRKELTCEGVAGMYDLLRLQKPLVRICQRTDYVEGHYTWGVAQLNGYDPTSAIPTGTLPSNDYRFICQIPQMEMVNNTALTAADQNPFSGQ